MKSLADLFGPNPPSNWGKWGPDDEIGCLNYLGPAEVISAIAEVKTGEVFTLQVPMGSDEPHGDPVWPPRMPIERQNTLDNAMFDSGAAPDLPGGLRYVDDTATIWLQGSTQYDALGHSWYDGQLWNGYDADTTNGAMTKDSILPVAEHGVVGRGVLIDMARYRGKKSLDKNETFTIDDVLAAAAAQRTEIRHHDIVVLRTGFVGSWCAAQSREAFMADFGEPGLVYSPELVRWFQDTEIVNLVSDSSANEVFLDPDTGFMLPLHAALQRNLGVLFTEIAWLDDLAGACAADNRWSFLYVAAPLKVVHGTGAPVNPVAIR
jgi:kynurenine formamidase